MVHISRLHEKCCYKQAMCWSRKLIWASHVGLHCVWLILSLSVADIVYPHTSCGGVLQCNAVASVASTKLHTNE